MARNGLPAQTAHSAFYTYEHVPKRDKKGKLVLKPNGKVDTEGKFIKKDTLDKDYSLIVIDEASMIPEAMAKDIFSFHIPIIAVGDLNQLPPVFGNSVFLQEPDVVLTKVMRQAEGDPIIYLAHRVLHGESLKVGVYKNSYVIRKEDLSDFQMQSADEILTGTNRLRLAINDKFRDEYLRFKYRDFPQPGEKVVCKKNNWERKIGGGIYLTNGMTGFVEYVDKSSYRKNSFTMDFKPDFGNREFRNLKVNYKRLMKPNEYDPEQEIDIDIKTNRWGDYAYAPVPLIQKDMDRIEEELNNFYLREDPELWTVPAYMRNKDIVDYKVEKNGDQYIFTSTQPMESEFMNMLEISGYLEFVEFNDGKPVFKTNPELFLMEE